MPRTRFDKPRYPPVDKLKAVILERKMVMHLTSEEIAKAANINPSYFRKIMTTKHTDDWSPDIRNAICRYMGINVKTVVEDLFDLSKEMVGK